MHSSALVELDQIPDYKVAAGEPDPRGWEIVGADAHTIGAVRTLLVDPGLLKARYFVCDLSPVRAMLLPVAYARLDTEHCRVIFDVIDAATCDQLADYTGTAPTLEEQRAIDDVMVGGVIRVQPGPSLDRRQSDRRSDAGDQGVAKSE